jgi:transposase
MNRKQNADAMRSALINKPRLCECGSGQPSEIINDGYGIYLCRACRKCRAQKLQGFRADIFTRYETDDRIEPID